MVDQLEAAAAADTLIVAESVGPYFGTAIVNCSSDPGAQESFPRGDVCCHTVAVKHAHGGSRRCSWKIVEKLGRPIVLYIKDQGYVTLDVVKSLVDAGAISWIKYAVVRG